MTDRPASEGIDGNAKPPRTPLNSIRGSQGSDSPTRRNPWPMMAVGLSALACVLGGAALMRGMSGARTKIPSSPQLSIPGSPRFMPTVGAPRTGGHQKSGVGNPLQAGAGTQGGGRSGGDARPATGGEKPGGSGAERIVKGGAPPEVLTPPVVHPKPSPGPSVPPTTDQQEELRYWCERLGHQAAISTLKMRALNPDGVALIVSGPDQSHPDTATLSVTSTTPCWFMLYDTSSGTAAPLLGTEKDPLGHDNLIIEPNTERAAGRDVDPRALFTTDLPASGIPTLSGLQGSKSLEFVVVAVSGVPDLSNAKNDLKEILGLLDKPEYKDARVSVCGWRGEWQEDKLAFKTKQVSHPAAH